MQSKEHPGHQPQQASAKSTRMCRLPDRIQRPTVYNPLTPVFGEGIVPIAQLLPAGAFGPEAVKAMTAAFEETLRELELLDHNDPLTEIVARKIIEGARLGVRDPIRLRELAVARFPERKNSAVPRT